MKKQDLRRLIKIENEINRIAKEELNLTYPDIEYDIVNDKKLLELMAYVIPTNFSHWTHGRDYEKIRTIHEQVQANLPLEMVLNSAPPRAYLSNANTLGVNSLVIAHVVGHVHHFTNNKYFNAQQLDIIDYLARASERFIEYERRYGINQVEPIIDAALALRFHSSPWDNETDSEQRERIFEQKKKNAIVTHTQYGEFFEEDYNKKIKEDVDSYNSKLWIELKNTIPVEPTEDILRFIIDNSKYLDDWQKDILEVNRGVGRYFHANIKNKLMAEGAATCLVGNSFLDTRRGMVPMKDIKINDLVFDGDQYQKVTNFFINYNKKRIKIITSSGIELHGGYNHKISVNGDWISLSELRKGDEIPIIIGNDEWPDKYVSIEYDPDEKMNLSEVYQKSGIYRNLYQRYINGATLRKNNKEKCESANIMMNNCSKNIDKSKRRIINIPDKLNEPMAYLLGLMVGDGNIRYKRSKCLCITTGDYEVVTKSAKIINDLFFVSPKIKKDGNRWRIMVESAVLCEFMVEYLGLTHGPSASFKKIPDKIFQSPKSVVSSFLQGYFDADGSCHSHVTCSSMSQELLKQVQIILNKMGIISYISSYKDKRYEDKIIYKLSMFGDNILKFQENIGFGIDRKNERLKTITSKSRWYLKPKHINRVVDIIEDYGDTYDITVETSHKYYVPGFINHNCIHTKIMNRLYELKAINNEEYSQYLHSNSLVKAQNPFGVNPYYVGSGILENIEERWNKGQYGEEWERCSSISEKRNWDTKEGKGWEKVLEVLKSYNDWNFMQEFLTEDVIDNLDLYIYEQVEIGDEVQLRRTNHTTKEIKELLVLSYAHSFVPTIYIVDGKRDLVLEHGYFGMELEPKNTVETMKHLQRIWGTPIYLRTVMDGENVIIKIEGDKAKKIKE
jgi:stage V sporulation protein R